MKTGSFCFTPLSLVFGSAIMQIKNKKINQTVNPYKYLPNSSKNNNQIHPTITLVTRHHHHHHHHLYHVLHLVQLFVSDISLFKSCFFINEAWASMSLSSIFHVLSIFQGEKKHWKAQKIAFSLKSCWAIFRSHTSFIHFPKKIVVNI